MPVYWVSRNGVLGSWKLPLGLGLASILIGSLFLFFPESSLRLIIYLFGAIVFLIGIALFVGAFSLSRGGTWFAAVPLILGICAIILGIVSFTNPSLIGAFLAVIVALVFLIGGLGMVFTAILQGGSPARRILSIIGGLFLAALGILIFFHAEFTGIFIIRLLGIFLVGAGIVALVGSFLLWRREQSWSIPGEEIPLQGDLDPYRKNW